MKLSWETFLEILAGEMESCDERLVRALLANKVLYLAGLRNRHLAEVAKEAGLKIMVVKTFKLFPYVPDEVDACGQEQGIVSRKIREVAEFHRFIGNERPPVIYIEI